MSELSPAQEPSPPAAPTPVERRESFAVTLTFSLAGAAALSYILVYLLVAAIRIPYPYDLEWTEGALAQQVLRVLQGKSLYTAPSIEYAPLVYTPLYPYLAAPFMWVLGTAFLPLRLFSFLASLGCFGMIFLIAHRESRSRFAGLLAVGLYAGTYRLGGAWFDLARVDSLMLLLLLASFYTALHWTSWRGAVGTALLLAATFLTKQSTAIVIAPILLAMLLRQPRNAILAGAVSATIVILTTLLFTLATDGWYWYYTVNQVNQTEFVKEVWVGFWTKDLASHYSIAGGFALVSLVFLFKDRGRKAPIWSYLLMTAGLLAMCYLSRLHGGGYDNVLMPAYAWIAVLAGLGIAAMRRRAQLLPRRMRVFVMTGVHLVCLVQFMNLHYDPLAQVPSAEHRKAGDELLQLIKDTPGPVFIQYNNFLPALVGKEIYVNRCAVWSLLFDEQMPEREKLDPGIPNALKEKKFDLVVMNKNHFNKLLAGAGYISLQDPVPHIKAFLTLTGLPTRPVYFFKLPEDPSGGIGAP